MILVPDHDLGVWASARFVDRYACSIDVGTILGGVHAISAQVEAQIRERMDTCRDTGRVPAPAPKPIVVPPHRRSPRRT